MKIVRYTITKYLFYQWISASLPKTRVTSIWILFVLLRSLLRFDIGLEKTFCWSVFKKYLRERSKVYIVHYMSLCVCLLLYTVFRVLYVNLVYGRILIKVYIIYYAIRRWIFMTFILLLNKNIECCLAICHRRAIVSYRPVTYEKKKKKSGAAVCFLFLKYFSIDVIDVLKLT